MIKITADIGKGSVRAEGHSGFDVKGRDIVCAAVSMLLYTYLEELRKLGVRAGFSDDGDKFEICPECCAPEVMTAFEMMLSGLMLLERSYGENVQLEVLKIV